MDFVVQLQKENTALKRQLQENLVHSGYHCGLALWKDKILSDVELVINKEYYFPCHKAVLAAVSPVFRKMFEGDFKVNCLIL